MSGAFSFGGSAAIHGCSSGGRVSPAAKGGLRACGANPPYGVTGSGLEAIPGSAARFPGYGADYFAG